MDYIKLSELSKSQSTILVESVGKPFWITKYVAGQQPTKYEVYTEGCDKKYTITTDKGLVNVSEGQLSSMLVKYHWEGQANIIGKKFLIKDNGKTGIDIRYYFNGVYGEKPRIPTNDEVPPTPDYY